MTGSHLGLDQVLAPPASPKTLTRTGSLEAHFQAGSHPPHRASLRSRQGRADPFCEGCGFVGREVDTLYFWPYGKKMFS